MYVLKNNKGSSTLEASIVLPLFLFFLLFFIYISNIYTVKGVIYEGAVETAEYMAEYAYLTDCFEDVKIADYPMAKVKFLEYVDEKALLDKYVVAGRNGISFLGSQLPDEDGYIDLKVTYFVHVDVPILGRFKHMFREHIRQKAYVGLSSDKSEKADKEDDDSRIVYVAKDGVVYHESRSCTYLMPDVRSCSLNAAKLKGYGKCRYCKGAVSGTVYVTADGEKYHTSRNCSRLRRTVYSKRKSEVTLPPCSKCGKNH